MWELDHKESWVPKKWCFQTFWCWRRLLRVPWTARRSNQSILKEISPEYSLEGLMLKLKLQHFGHLMQRTDHWKRPWWWERLKAGGEGDDRGWDGWMASLSWWTWVWASSWSWWWTGKPSVLQSMGLQIVRCNWATELRWTDEGQYPEFSYRLDIEVKRGKIVIPLQAKGTLLGRKWVRDAVVVSSSHIVRISTQESNTQY